MTEKDIKNAAVIIRLGREMENAGFPFCHNDYGFPMHCKTCIEMYKRIKEQQHDCQVKSGRGA